MTSKLMVDLDGSFKLEARSSDPSDPIEGVINLWLSDGTASGGDGDLMAKRTAGGSTTTVNLTGVLTGADEIRVVDSLPGTPEAGVIYLLRP